ncbi:hypothetical protein GCM10010377_71060 [Streptomyces viridiviolaceus]|uniref:Uncharacterized protein n=1 Tax=Streptomyces viridiviolaceus TaxID=68282 RepID=A0ABW2E9H4_9ACTN|nr:hypothetical protein [Streptomyces viridiviolaceus]GHB70132.1 hypothetical protein GCM10010377_71060 [Streptomyces viridiviolaceus]
MTTVQPAASADASLKNARTSGKFHSVIAVTTPRGLRVKSVSPRRSSDGLCMIIDA